MSRQPWMKFYPADWQSDHLLRSCSVAARGLWIELLCIMQKAEPVGHLLVNGKAPTPALLAILCGISEREAKRLLNELRSAGVFDEVDGVIVSRRMVRDADKAERDKANGQKGGNPKIKGGVNPEENQRAGGEDKAHIPEARSQKASLGASAPSTPAAPDPFEAFWQIYPRRAGANPKKPAKAKFEKLVRDGADPELIINGARLLSVQHAKPTPYVPQAVRWLNEERFRDEAPHRPAADVGEADWHKRLEHARKTRNWSTTRWGPFPGRPGCLVPAGLLRPDDGEGWEDRGLQAASAPSRQFAGL